MQGARNRRHGFALIVVLSTLSIIALLFAIASSRAIGRLAETRTDLLVAQDAAARAALLRFAAQAYAAADASLAPEDTLPVTWRGEPALMMLQDAGGLIDLNTANPAMLEQVAKALGITSEGIERYRRWRRTPLRLQRVSDFARVTQAPSNAGESLRRIATVVSGRPGIAAALAPQGSIGSIGWKAR